MNQSMVSDTMAIILRLEKRRLPVRVRTLFEEAEQNMRLIYLPAMALAEIGYLSERKRIEVTLQDAHDYCAAHQSFEVVPLTGEIVTQSFIIDDIPELHDRLIAGTAYAKHAQLITNDPVISRSRYVSVVW